MSQAILSITNSNIITEESFLTPGRVWSDNTGKIFDVKEPDA